MALNKTPNTNLASEFFVASQLFRLGYVVTVTLGQTKEIDLFVAHPDGRTITIDVKGLKSMTNWPLNPKLKREGHFYVLVSYRGKVRDLNIHPDVFVIPSLEVEKVLHRWTGRRNVTCIRYRDVKNSKYENAWGLFFNH